MAIFLKYLIISFISSAILIFISKIVLDKLIRRDIDYYEKEERDIEENMLSNIKIVKISDEER